MQYRNLKRYLLFKKALKKYNKKSTWDLRPKEIVLLLSVFYLSSMNKRTTVKGIDDYLRQISQGEQWLRLLPMLERLVSIGLLEFDNIYRLSSLGTVVLRELEMKLRKERVDK